MPSKAIKVLLEMIPAVLEMLACCPTAQALQMLYTCTTGQSSQACTGEAQQSALSWRSGLPLASAQQQVFTDVNDYLRSAFLTQHTKTEAMLCLPACRPPRGESPSCPFCSKQEPP